MALVRFMQILALAKKRLDNNVLAFGSFGNYEIAALEITITHFLDYCG